MSGVPRSNLDYLDEFGAWMARYYAERTTYFTGEEGWG